MIIVDSDNYLASGIETMFFPGGEPHVKIPGYDQDVMLYLKLRTWNDVGIAVCVLEALSRNTSEVLAFIPYFPGARQDRADASAPLTAEIMVDLIGKYLHPEPWEFPKIHVFDAHSKVIIERGGFLNWMPTDLPYIPKRHCVVGVIAPDAGAVKRATLFRDKLYPGAALLECDKHRDPHTGKLSGYRMPSLPMAGHYIIVDDICDGGGTFNLLTEEFATKRFAPESTLELFVSHGIFSKGLENISPLISKITTTDSWCQLPSSKRLSVLPLSPLFPKIMGERS